MAESQQKPIYSVYIISGSTKYNVTTAINYIDRADPKGQIAQRVSLQLVNIQVNGTLLSNILQARNRVYVYATYGGTEDEVFRGFLWRQNNKNSVNDRELKYVCYDNLIYLQESEDSLYFSAGKTTKDVVSSICSDWEVDLEYSYDSITHAKLPLRGTIYDILTADILDLVKKKKGTKYVVRSEKDTMYVMPVGTNATIYQFIAGKNVISTTSGWTMEGMITKVIIVGKANDDGKVPIEATVTGKTDEYGTLQKIQDKDSETTLEDAKLEAQYTIDENGTPKWEYEIVAPDIPWIRKGDKVYVNAGDIVQKYLIVTDIDRAGDNKKIEMTLTLEES